MFRIAALNDSSSDSDSGSENGVAAPITKEAQESEALNLYNKALSLQRQGDLHGAQKVFHSILDLDLIQEALPPEEDEDLVHPGLKLKYSTCKNLGCMAMQNEDYPAAMEALLQAVMIDWSDVTVWYKIGVVSLKLHQYPLARHAFEQGLECNPNHWPCMDHLITVLYALNNYEVCLYYAARALERDCDYTKGLVFRHKIFSEQKSLRAESVDLFLKCDPSIDEFVLTEEDLDEFVNEALEIRKKKQELSQPPERATVTLPQLPSLTWKCFGESLVSLYDSIATAESPMSFNSKVDLTQGSCDKAEEQQNKPVAMETEVTTSLQAETVPVPTSLPVVTSSVSQPVSSAPTVSVPFPPLLMVAPSMMSESTPSTPTTDQPANLFQNVETSTPMDVDEPSLGQKRGPKRKRLQMSDDAGTKRRSARVRGNSSKVQEKVISLQELLTKFLPSSLTTVSSESETDEKVVETMATPKQTEAEQTSSSSEVLSVDVKTFSDAEETEIAELMKKSERNSGVIDLINKYLIRLSKKNSLVWPEGLSAVFLKAYARIRKHFDYPSLIGCDDSVQRVNDMADMCVMWAELKLDQWLMNRARSNLSPGGSPIKSPGNCACLGPDFPGQYYEHDLRYLVSLTGSELLSEDACCTFSARVFWCQARFLMLQNKMEFAVDSFDRTKLYLSYLEDSGLTSVSLPYCQLDNKITSEDVKKQLESLQRCQSLEEVQRLHDNGNHERVVTLLLNTFTQPPRAKVMEGLPERHAQLLLLQDSLLKMDDYQRCLLWGEVSLNEALQHYKNAKSTTKDDWISTMTQLFVGLDKCLSSDSGIISTLPSSRLVRLTSNLMAIIDLAMDVPDSVYEMLIPTTLPWILLYRLIEHEEKKLRSLARDAESDFTDCIQSSVMLLNVAHEYLGRRSWCVTSDGALLLFTVEVMMKELRRSSNDTAHMFKDELEQALEQCFYCLYGHPNKRTKAKHLHDHNVPQISLTWDRSAVVFEYFKPKNVPEFDSYKTSTVSAELENLLRRISLLVPSQVNLANTTDSVTAYIEGTINSPPEIPEDNPVTLPIVKELYYLLADYYFKNKEQGKAIKFYILDLCVNPDRFDAWAGMALARSSRLEQKLNSHELKTEGHIQKHSISALRCYKRALELDGSNSKLWIEYGSLAYQLHSHTARLLKQHHAGVYSLTSDVLELSMNTKREMLQISHNCYVKASQSEHEAEEEENEEEWLPQYMLGKLAEKMGLPLNLILNHYKKAAFYLHEDYANYPKKITYIYSPPRLAVEALEMFYRLHVIMVKKLLHQSALLDLDMCEKFLQEAAEGLFAKNTEKKYQAKERDTSTSQDEDGSISGNNSNFVPMVTPQTAPALPKKRKPTYHMTPQDHDYSKQKSIDSSSADESSLDLIRSPRVTDNEVTPKSKDGRHPNAESSLPAENKTGELPQQQISMGNILGDVITKEFLSVSEPPIETAVSERIASSPMAVPLTNVKAEDIEETPSKSLLSKPEIKITDLKDEKEIPVTLKDEPMETDDLDKEEVGENQGRKTPTSTKQNIDTAEINIATVSGSTEIDYKTNPAKLETEPPGEKPSNQPEKSTASIAIEADSSSQDSGFLPPEVADELEKLKAQLLDLESDAPLPTSYRSVYREEELVSQKSQDSQASSHASVASVSDEQSSSQTSAVANDELEKLKAQILDLESCMQSPTTTNAPTSVPGLVQSEPLAAKSEASTSTVNVKEEPAVIDTIQASDKENESSLQSADDHQSIHLPKEKQSINVDDGIKKLNENEQSTVSDIRDTESDADMPVLIREKEEVRQAKSDQSDAADKQDAEGNRCEDVIMKDEPMDEVPTIDKCGEPVLAKPDEKSSENAICGKMSQFDCKNAEAKKPAESSPIPQNTEKLKESKTSSNNDHQVDSGSAEVLIKNAESSAHDSEITNTKITEKQPDDKLDDKLTTKETEEEEAMDIDMCKDLLSVITPSDDEEQMKPKEQMRDSGNNGKKTAKKKDLTEEEIQAEKTSFEERQKAEEEKRKRLIDGCIAAFQLCLSRFPQHFKSLYRLAYIYYHSPFHKDLEKCSDLLLGDSGWQQKAYMASQGLFQDRKQTNFFNGIWRVPIEEIDRPGNFATHIMRSMLLLVDVLREMKNHNRLFYVHLQMQRTPDLGKKYLRDTDRVHISKLAFQGCMSAIAAQIEDKQDVSDADVSTKLVMDVNKVWQHGIRNVPNTAHRLNKLLLNAYKLHTKQSDMPTLEQVARFCQAQAALKPPATPGNTDGSTKSATSTPSNLMSPTAKMFSPLPSKSDVKTPSSDRVSVTDAKTLTSAVQSKLASVDPVDASASVLSLPSGINPIPAPPSAQRTNQYNEALKSPKPQSPVRVGTEEVKKLIKPCSVKLQPPAGFPGSPGRTNQMSPSRSPITARSLIGSVSAAKDQQHTKDQQKIIGDNLNKKLDFTSPSTKPSVSLATTSSKYEQQSAGKISEGKRSAEKVWPKYSSQAKYYQKNKSLLTLKKSTQGTDGRRASTSSSEEVLRKMLPTGKGHESSARQRSSSVTSSSSTTKQKTPSSTQASSSSNRQGAAAATSLSPQILFPGLAHGVPMSVLAAQNLPMEGFPMGSVYPVALGLGGIPSLGNIPTTSTLSNQMLLQHSLLSSTNLARFTQQQQQQRSSGGQSSKAQKSSTGPKSSGSVSKAISHSASVPGSHPGNTKSRMSSTSSSDSDVILISSSSQDSSDNDN